METKIYACDACKKQTENLNEGWNEIWWDTSADMFGSRTIAGEKKYMLCHSCHFNMRDLLKNGFDIVKMQAELRKLINFRYKIESIAENLNKEIKGKL